MLPYIKQAKNIDKAIRTKIAAGDTTDNIFDDEEENQASVLHSPLSSPFHSIVSSSSSVTHYTTQHKRKRNIEESFMTMVEHIVKKPNTTEQQQLQDTSVATIKLITEAMSTMQQQNALFMEAIIKQQQSFMERMLSDKK